MLHGTLAVSLLFMILSYYNCLLMLTCIFANRRCTIFLLYYTDIVNNCITVLGPNWRGQNCYVKYIGLLPTSGAGPVRSHRGSRCMRGVPRITRRLLQTQAQILGLWFCKLQADHRSHVFGAVRGIWYTIQAALEHHSREATAQPESADHGRAHPGPVGSHSPDFSVRWGTYTS